MPISLGEDKAKVVHRNTHAARRPPYLLETGDLGREILKPNTLNTLYMHQSPSAISRASVRERGNKDKQDLLVKSRMFPGPRKGLLP
jgi:hypothetical protein